MGKADRDAWFAEGKAPIGITYDWENLDDGETSVYHLTIFLEAIKAEVQKDNFNMIRADRRGDDRIFSIKLANWPPQYRIPLRSWAKEQLLKAIDEMLEPFAQEKFVAHDLRGTEV